MATVLNRTTKQLIRSANTPDYPVLDWIIGPDLSAVSGWPERHWNIAGDVVTLMDAAARDAVDAAILEGNRDATAGEIDDLENLVRALALAILDEQNKHANKINAILDAIDGASNFAGVKAAIAAIADYPQRTIADLKAEIRLQLGS